MKIVIPEIPPSLNRFAGRMNVHEYREMKARWKQLVCLLSRKDRPKEPFAQAVVCITYFFKDARRRDPDNYSGKMILDGLTAAGVITDDSFSNIKLTLEGHVDRKNPRTEIEVKEHTHEES